MAVKKTKKAAAKKKAAKKAPAKKAVKKAAKKAPAKKVVKKAAKKAPAKKAAAKAPAKKTTAIKDRYNKTQIMTEIADNTGLSKKEVGAVFDELAELMERHVKKRACGEFVLPGLMKVTTVRKPAQKARKGINPFTGEETMFKAKPARTVVKVRPLKKLKEMAE